MEPNRIRVGCSGWQYKHWRADFYPAELRTANWFHHYAQTFDTVEINNSFYRWPAPETFAKWSEQAPKRFLYAVKASRFLTHLKKLKEPEEPVSRTFDHVKELGPHLGPLLYQLPPGFQVNTDRLDQFLKTISRPVRETGLKTRPYQAIEFREPSWYTDGIFALLRKHKVALCLHDMQGSATGKVVVGPFIYVRYHFGTKKYGGRYDDDRLDDWADWLAECARKGMAVFAYFNNDTGGHAPRDAIRLRDRIHARL